MASSGSYNTSAYGSGNYYRYLVFSWSVQSQSVANNSTTISYELKGAGGNTTSYQMAGNFKLLIDGQNVFETGQNDRIQLKNGTVVKSGTFTLYHDSVGNRSFGSEAWGAINSYARNVYGSGSWSLPNIPRNSSGRFNKTSYTIGDTITINFTRASSAFTEDGYVQFPDIAGWVWQGQKFFSGAGDSWTWTPTAAEVDMLYAQIPNAKSAAMWADCKTFYNGSDIGHFSVGEATMSVNPSVCSPTFTASYKDTNASIVAVTENDQLIVQGQSTLQVSITNATARKSATLASATCLINGTTYTGTISSGTCNFNIGVLNISSDTTATVTVTDSRGISTSQDLTITIIPYYQPSAIITTERQNNYYSPTTVNVDASYASVDGKNSIQIKVRYKKASDSSWGNYVTFQDNVPQVLTLDNQYEWYMQVVLVDLYSTVTYNTSVSRGMPIVYFDRLLSATGFNCFPDSERGVYSEGLQLDNNICVGSQVLYDSYLISSLTTVTILSAYNYDLIDGMFANLTLPIGYERAIRISAQISTSNANTAKVALNNLETSTGATYSNANYRKIITSDIMKVSDLVLEPTVISSSRDGLNLELINGGSTTGNAYFYNVTLHGYIVKSD